MGFRGVNSFLGIALVLIYAIGSGIWVSHSPGWYSSLVKPPWQPPDLVFGLIWPYNFIVLGIVSFQVPQRMSRTTSLLWLILFAFSIVSALLWAYHFYVPHNLTFAAICLGITAALTLPLLYVAYRTSWVLGALLTPYQVWVLIATTLAWGYVSRNS